MAHFIEYPEFFDMVHLDQENSTQCAVYDKTPGSEQKKINIVVRPAYTVGKVISDITTQFNYKSFDLLLQPVTNTGDLVYLNDCQNGLIYAVKGFEPHNKNNLILLPPGVWDGNVKKRYDLSLNVLNYTPYENTGSNNNNNTNNNNNNCNNINNSNALFEGFSSPSSPMTTVTNTTTTSMADSLHLSPLTDPDLLSDDDLALGASASPTETEPMNGSSLLLGQSSPPSSSLDIKYGPMLEDAYKESSVADKELNIPIEDLYKNKFGPMREEIDKLYKNKFGQTNFAMKEESYKDSTSNAAVERFNSSASCMKKYPLAAVSTSSNGYVGLVNQAMTCYLNSLLQALYMTPEFRNALYRWEYDNDSEEKNIPYQLQKLFLNLQTSKKSAVETTDLTRSFGWDSTEAWHQHDIQELCRVMFDALEHKFKNTKQANLISNLYEGKMIDYVKCLECETEKTRADTFLDIPLPVRPFGSTTAYGSIEEALRAFVQPETLDGNNQYFCEKCNKKCDAHKGLKFKNFPYVLTLHLKRFDFDYSTMHRIKLNDKVTFPQTLNLNSFINAADAEQGANLEAQAASAAAHSAAAAAAETTINGFIVNGVGANSNTDDCSTTDSGSAMEEDTCSSGVPTTACSSQHENDMQDEDEGIDMSTSTDHRTAASSEVDQCLKNSDTTSGSYLYELFAIMIHSGSASGGHYYAYIKEFENNEWFCFNDQTVSSITQEDIQKSFGGSSTKAYYSSVYSSSTNAYMLMYRQMDAKRNEQAMQTSNFPEHITKQLSRLNNEDEDETRRHHSSSRYNFSELSLPDVSKQRVYFYNPQLKKLKVTRVYASRSFNIDLLLQSAYLMLNVEDFAPMTRCRLVGYDSSSEEILQSFENVSDSALEEIRSTCDYSLDFLLEYRAEGQEFEIYKPGGATWSVYMVNLNTMEMDGPYLVYSAAHEKDDVLKHSIAVRLHVNENELLLATLANKKAFVAYDPAPTAEAEDNLQSVAKLQFRTLTYFYLNVPSTDAESLQVLGIPSLDSQTPPAIEVSADVVDAVLMNGGVGCNSMVGDSSTIPTNSCLSAGDYNRRESPSLPAVAGHESNSEDSSLSDGDRTLVESIHNRGGGDSQVSSTSHSPQLSSPEDEPTPSSAAMSRINDFFNSSMPSIGSEDMSATSAYSGYPARAQFFHAIKIEPSNKESTDTTTAKTSSAAETDEDVPPKKPESTYKLIVHSHMKMQAFKRHIETLIRVPANYFKVTQKHDAPEPITATQSLAFLSEGDTLIVQLGKILQENEYKAKIFFMKLSELDDDTGKLPCVCEWICRAGMTVLEAKKALIAQLQCIDSKYETLTLDNCRMWTKGGRNPITILSDKETLGNEVRLSVACEFILQECEGGIKPQVSDETLTLFVRRWYPDTLQLGKFEEITLGSNGIISTLAELSKIAENKISYSKVNSSFPCTSISLLNINGSMGWNTIPASVGKYPLTNSDNGNIYFYKDLTVPPKELTMEERRELNAKEKARLERLGCYSISVYSPRRERALKIHLDSSPQASTTTSLKPEPIVATNGKTGLTND